MALFNGSAIGTMLKAMFPAVIEKVQVLEDDGTIDKIVYVFQEMAKNGTAEKLLAFAAALDRNNNLMQHIAALLEEANGYSPEPAAGPANAGLIEHDGVRVPEPAGTD